MSKYYSELLPSKDELFDVELERDLIVSLKAILNSIAVNRHHFETARVTITVEYEPAPH